jgi:EAL domain-containing protein (putative c-di-GMP-specific phosphodiesterase class I)/CheY-like chemotaxis protein
MSAAENDPSPVREAERAHDAVPAVPAERAVLLVDDDELSRGMLGELLTDAGYAVTSCGGGPEALAAIRRRVFAAVLSDISMPDMSGLELLRAIGDLDLDLPVVLLTGGPSIETSVEAMEWGALQYLIKPVATAKLLEVMARAVKLCELARMKREALVAVGSGNLIGDRAGLDAAFGRALRGLWMAYQPIVRARDGAVEGYEALLRTAETSFPHPGALLSAAESLGRLADLGSAVRGAVAGQLASGALSGGWFVNLHPLDLSDDRLFDGRAPLSHFASSVVLEITERASLIGISDVARRVRMLRELGYRIAIDDLGAGYAGLTSLATLAPEFVKFDMALIRGIDADSVKQKLVGSMSALCHDLGILVVAEGVETEGERQAAVAAGCDFLQGYLFGRPARMRLPAPEFGA